MKKDKRKKKIRIRSWKQRELGGRRIRRRERGGGGGRGLGEEESGGGGGGKKDNSAYYCFAKEIENVVECKGHPATQASVKFFGPKTKYQPMHSPPRLKG